MSLLEIKHYLMRVKIASLSSLSAYFNCDPACLRSMLTHWVRKGCVRQCTNRPTGCATKCVQCKVSTVEIYEWVAPIT